VRAGVFCSSPEQSDTEPPTITFSLKDMREGWGGLLGAAEVATALAATERSEASQRTESDACLAAPVEGARAGRA